MHALSMPLRAHDRHFGEPLVLPTRRIELGYFEPGLPCGDPPRTPPYLCTGVSLNLVEIGSESREVVRTNLCLKWAFRVLKSQNFPASAQPMVGTHRVVGCRGGVVGCREDVAEVSRGVTEVS